MRHLLKLLLASALLLGGCSTEVNAPEATSPLSCDADSALSDAAARSLLAKISVYSPQDGLTGDARAIAQGWANLVANGWPVPVWRNGQVARNHLRQMQIRFGADDRVQAVSVRSGGSKSGILIGTPAEVVRLIHGPSSNFVYALREGQALEFKVEGGVVVEIQVH